MARIAGVVIPDDKQVQVSLTYIYGIGPKFARDILAAAKIEPTTRVKDLITFSVSVGNMHMPESTALLIFWF